MGSLEVLGREVASPNLFLPPVKNVFTWHVLQKTSPAGAALASVTKVIPLKVKLVSTQLE